MQAGKMTVTGITTMPLIHGPIPVTHGTMITMMIMTTTTTTTTTTTMTTMPMTMRAGAITPMMTGITKPPASRSKRI